MLRFAILFCISAVLVGCSCSSDNPEADENYNAASTEQLINAVQASELDAKTIKQALADGANPNATLPSGRPLMIEAIYRDHWPLAEALLKAGAAPNTTTTKGITALALAQRRGSLAIMVQLVRGRADGAESLVASLAKKSDQTDLEQIVYALLASENIESVDWANLSLQSVANDHPFVGAWLFALSGDSIGHINLDHSRESLAERLQWFHDDKPAFTSWLKAMAVWDPDLLLLYSLVTQPRQQYGDSRFADATLIYQAAERGSVLARLYLSKDFVRKSRLFDYNIRLSQAVITGNYDIPAEDALLTAERASPEHQAAATSAELEQYIQWWEAKPDAHLHGPLVLADLYNFRAPITQSQVQQLHQHFLTVESKVSANLGKALRKRYQYFAESAGVPEVASADSSEVETTENSYPNGSENLAGIDALLFAIEQEDLTKAIEIYSETEWSPEEHTKLTTDLLQLPQPDAAKQLVANGMPTDWGDPRGNLLHIASIQRKTAWIDWLETLPELAQQKNVFGKTPAELRPKPVAATSHAAPKTGFELLDEQGAATTADAACAKDRVTGLIWQIKQASGMHNQRYRFTWQHDNSQPKSTTACGNTGCLVDNYIVAANTQKLCGQQTWRVPTMFEFESLPEQSVAATLFHSEREEFYWTTTAFSPDRPELLWLQAFPSYKNNTLRPRHLSANLLLVSTSN